MIAMTEIHEVTMHLAVKDTIKQDKTEADAVKQSRIGKAWTCDAEC